MRSALTGLLLIAALSGCEAQWPLGEVSTLPGTCCEQRGSCISQSAVSAREVELLGRGECEPETVCVPEPLQSRGAQPMCTVASTGAEGRCLPACLAKVAEQADRLARDGCGEQDRCVPCYDPLSGVPTGACSLTGDPGPARPPVLFERCCGAMGRCLPGQFVPEAQRRTLGQDSCEASQLCAPAAAAESGEQYVPARCTSSLLPDLEGRCLPACLPVLAREKGRLSQDGCATGELCAPCFDPRTGKPTESCSLGSDRPTQNAKVFDTCCGGDALCVPSRIVSEAEREHLAATGCGAADQLCVPSELLMDRFVPLKCVVPGVNREGRCLPACLPELAAEGERLSRGTCPLKQLCAPCFDPITGLATGSCEFGADSGPTEAAQAFGRCCAGLGRCVPESAVASEERGELSSEGCESERELCAPEAWLEDPNAAANSCRVSALGAEGRCLPECLPAVQAQGSRLVRDGCGEHERCVPCYEPVHGEPSGACGLRGDKGPVEAPKLLSKCCGGAGLCAPKDWVPPDVAEFLGREGCESAGDALCVAPAAALDDPDRFAPPSCRDRRTGGEGRCLPVCLRLVAERAEVLDAASCGAGELCVPCFDPLDGRATGACGLGSDAPLEPALEFDACCVNAVGESEGVCVPKTLAPAGTADTLPVDTCRAQDSVCAPRALAMDPSTVLPRCTTLLISDGVCLPSCFLPALAVAGNCPSGNSCVACSALSPGVGGCGRAR